MSIIDFVNITSHRQYQQLQRTFQIKIIKKSFWIKDGHYDDTLCNVFRAGISNKSKISSYGFLATFLNCSVIVGFTEQPCSEGSKYDSLS